MERVIGISMKVLRLTSILGFLIGRTIFCSQLSNLNTLHVGMERVFLLT
jgi:hypothetical protein